jgi:hypothetical protein
MTRDDTFTFSDPIKQFGKMGFCFICADSMYGRSFSELVLG